MKPDLFDDFKRAVAESPVEKKVNVKVERKKSGGRFFVVCLLVALVAAFVIWASRSEVETVVRGIGQVIPDSSKQIVQSLDGGVISEIPVREGQKVKAGDVILRLDDKRYSAIHESNVATRDVILARMARLEAEAKGATEISFPSNLVNHSVVQAEKDLFESRRNDLLVKLSFKKKLLAKERERYEASRKAFSTGALPKTDKIALEAKIIELEEALSTLEPEFKRQALEAHDRERERLAALVTSMKADEDRMVQTVLRSPIDGVVNNILISTIGRVVSAGEPIMEIIPEDDALIIEVKIRPADIAFLYQGQRANINFTAFDFSIYGGLEGTVKTIGVDTVIDEVNEDTYYPVKVETTSNTLGADPNTGLSLDLVPGMIANVNILTGKRTVLDYLLKPINKARQEALREP